MRLLLHRLVRRQLWLLVRLVGKILGRRLVVVLQRLCWLLVVLGRKLWRLRRQRLQWPC